MMLICFCLMSLAATGAMALTDPGHPGDFDARGAIDAEAWPEEAQLRRVAELRQRFPNITVRYDERSGATRVLWNRDGYLTDVLPGATTQDAVFTYLTDHLDLLGLTPNDWVGRELQSEFVNGATGATRIYLNQTFEGRPVYNAILQANVNRDGRLLSINNSFVPRIADVIQRPRKEIGLDGAVRAFAAHLSVETQTERLAGERSGPSDHRIAAPGLSRDVIEGRRVWLPVDRDSVRLVWNFQVATLDGQHHYDVTVDAESAKIWTRFDWVDEDEYRVYPQPVESPSHTTPLPPSDGRIVVANPQDPGASPLGWHDDGTNNFTIMRGNNVHAYEDSDANNEPPFTEPDCGAALSCDFGIDLSLEPNTYREASVANLFYWNNLIHDVQYQYGFDEAAGNFQADNFGLGGVGNDPVDAEAQDGGGTNNANFLTPSDGNEPRMQMFLWNGNPAIDGDLDNAIIAHEYGHGISNRQVGGPVNVSCLSNQQQMGEGWSDWLGLWYTAQATDVGTDGRGIGTYALGEDPDGPGIRIQRYSTDPSINDWTYETIGTGVPVPHGVGAVWAQALWELYWGLVDAHGFSVDIYDAQGGTGNQRAMLYVNEGMQNTVCSPTFLDARDGVLQAVQDNFGGEDYCLAWTAFAGMGLGEGATTGGNNTLIATNDFTVPSECGGCNILEDADCDGVLDPMDNCLLIANPDQRDSNDDRFGNRCDPDLNNDLIVNFLDLGIFRDVIFTTDEDADFNGDGVVNFLDLGIMRDLFFLPPGPTGIEPVSIPCGACPACLSCNWVPEFTAALQPTGLIRIAFTNLLDPDRMITSLQVEINGGGWQTAGFNVGDVFDYDPPVSGTYQFRAEGFESQFPEPCDTDCSDESQIIVVP